ncbi:MAG: sorbosone dehydrogenase family protein [Actinomycetota bacterium]
MATGLEFPAAFTFAKSGRIYFGERLTGWIDTLDPKTGHHHRIFHVPSVVSDGEQGLLGIALAPGFPGNPSVYVYATRSVGGLKNQILRIAIENGKGTAMHVVFTSSTEAGSYHDGGHIAFGPDGMLFAIVGESHSAGNAQDLEVSGGKILRMTPSGGIPSGNPFHSRVYAYGIRNSFGFTFDPQTGRLWESENGPSCNDELNRIMAGRNYGWGPSNTCDSPPDPPRNTNRDGKNPVQPLRWYTPTIAPTGVAFCTACGLGAGSNGRLFFGAYNTGDIRRINLTSNRMGVASQQVVYHHDSGVLSVERAPNGGLYFSDGQGIFRLIRG